jgi:sporulation protein YlmC with PRC-barrel domain
MYIILNQEGEKIGYINNMIILDETKEKVLGILIGDCFFGKSTKVVGKIFNSTAYLVNGEIVGKVERNKEQKASSIKKAQLLEAWDILANVKEHTCEWIKETKKWSKKPLEIHLG